MNQITGDAISITINVVGNAEKVTIPDLAEPEVGEGGKVYFLSPPNQPPQIVINIISGNAAQEQHKKEISQANLDEFEEIAMRHRKEATEDFVRNAREAYEGNARS